MRDVKIIRLRDWRQKKRQRVGAIVAALIVIGVTGVVAYDRLAGPDLPRVTAFAPAASAQGPGAYRVVDGDTIHAPFGVKYRLMGFDTPEIHFAKCTEEFALGMEAKERLEALLASGEVRVIESGRTDKYRRTLAHVKVNGRDVGEILIGEGLARPYKGGKREPWC